MRKSLEDFFNRSQFAGLAACGARLPDGMIIHQCFDRWLTPSQVRQAIAHLSQASETLGRHGHEPVTMNWVFEHLRVCSITRQDRACLALFLENRPELSIETVWEVLREFTELSLTPE